MDSSFGEEELSLDPFKALMLCNGGNLDGAVDRLSPKVKPISAKLAAPRQAGKPAFYAMASAPALKAIRSLAGPGQLSSFVNVNGRETPALLTLF
jgi:hypothetical protein